MTITPKKTAQFKAKIFYALSDPARLQALEFIRNQEKCVCEIVPHLNIIQPLVSRHLKILKNAGIIRCRKDSTKHMYSVAYSQIYDVIDVLNPQLITNLTKEAIENVACR